MIGIILFCEMISFLVLQKMQQEGKSTIFCDFTRCGTKTPNSLNKKVWQLENEKSIKDERMMQQNLLQHEKKATADFHGDEHRTFGFTERRERNPSRTFSLKGSLRHSTTEFRHTKQKQESDFQACSFSAEKVTCRPLISKDAGPTQIKLQSNDSPYLAPLNSNLLDTQSFPSPAGLQWPSLLPAEIDVGEKRTPPLRLSLNDFRFPLSRPLSPYGCPSFRSTSLLDSPFSLTAPLARIPQPSPERPLRLSSLPGVEHID